MVVFSKLAISVPAFTCINTTILEVASAKYLGLKFHQHGLFTYEPLLNERVAAWAVLRRQYAGLRCEVSVSMVSHGPALQSMCPTSGHAFAKYGANLQYQLP